MKPKEKRILTKNRGLIIRTIEMEQMTDVMKKGKVITADEERTIMVDPGRRQRASKFLDILETKKTICYEVFLNALEEYYPHLYLSIVEWDGENDVGVINVDDEWSGLRQLRKWLAAEMDANTVLPYLREKEIVTEDEAVDVRAFKTTKEGTLALLDILETKSGNAYEIFLESLGEIYPHIYLMLTDKNNDDDQFDW